MDKKKLLIKSIVYAVVAFMLAVASVFAWFIYDKRLSEITVDSELKDVDFSLYEYIYETADFEGDAFTFEDVAGSDKFVAATSAPATYTLIPGFDRFFRLDLVLTDGLFANVKVYLSEISTTLSAAALDKYREALVVSCYYEESDTVISTKIFQNGTTDVLIGEVTLAPAVPVSFYFSYGLDITKDIPGHDGVVLTAKRLLLRY